MLFRVLSPGGSSARLSIFIFHRVLPVPDPLLPDDPDVVWFERIVRFVTSAFTVLPLSEAVQCLRLGRLPRGAACITFDDGYADNHACAAPILERHGACATFFISTAFIDGGRMWNDTVIEAVRAAPAGLLDWPDLGLEPVELGDASSRVAAYRRMLETLKYRSAEEREDLVREIAQRAGLPARCPLMMTREQVCDLRARGMELGAHTLTHPILSRLDTTAARHEIAGSREILGSWLGEPPKLFAYPNGRPGRDFSSRDVELVRECGFLAAVTTAAGCARVGDDLMQLPRFTPWDRDMWRFALRCGLNLSVRPEPLLAEGARAPA